METDGSDFAIRRQKPSEQLHLRTSTGLPPIESSTLLNLGDVGQRYLHYALTTGCNLCMLQWKTGLCLHALVFSCCFLARRGFSRKLHEMVKQQKETEAGSAVDVRAKKRKEKVELKNWKQLTPAQLSKLTPMQRSRYMMVCYDTVDYI